MGHVGLPAALALATAAFGALLLAGGATARRFERLAIGTTIFLATAYAVDLSCLHPALGPIVEGAMVPSLPGPGAALAVVGIVGATIMPHNLFLHGGLIVDRLRARPAGRAPRDRTRRGRTTVFALAIATLVNGAILVVGGAVHATTVEAAFATLVPGRGARRSTLFRPRAHHRRDRGDGERRARRRRRLPRRAHRCASRCSRAASSPSRPRRCCSRSASRPRAAGRFADHPRTRLAGRRVPLLALVMQGTLHRTHGGRFLLASSSAVVLGALACDGFLLTTFLPRT